MTVKRPLEQFASDLNLIARFLARRDIQLEEAPIWDPEGVWIVLLGSSLPSTCGVAARAWADGWGKQIIVSGGIGHSSPDLWATVANDPQLGGIPVLDRPEADIFRDILVTRHGVPADLVAVENRSTNCGSNAVETRSMLDQLGIQPKRLLIIQDPTMQRRSHASFERAWEKVSEIEIVSYAPFIPELVLDEAGNLTFAGLGPEAWSLERFTSLVLGEVTRLRNDESGYGPRGRNYIGPVEIPEDVEAANLRIRDVILNPARN